MMSKPVHNLKYLKEARRELRRKATPEEDLLWAAIRRSQLNGKKFKRQHSIGPYIADFYCAEEMLIVEIDGAHHFSAEQKLYDKERTAYLEQHNIVVLRFTNSQITKDISLVLNEIKHHFKN